MRPDKRDQRGRNFRDEMLSGKEKLFGRKTNDEPSPPRNRGNRKDTRNTNRNKNPQQDDFKPRGSRQNGGGGDRGPISSTSGVQSRLDRARGGGGAGSTNRDEEIQQRLTGSSKGLDQQQQQPSSKSYGKNRRVRQIENLDQLKIEVKFDRKNKEGEVPNEDALKSSSGASSSTPSLTPNVSNSKLKATAPEFKESKVTTASMSSGWTEMPPITQVATTVGGQNLVFDQGMNPNSGDWAAATPGIPDVADPTLMFGMPPPGVVPGPPAGVPANPPPGVPHTGVYTALHHQQHQELMNQMSFHPPPNMMNPALFAAAAAAGDPTAFAAAAGINPHLPPHHAQTLPHHQHLLDHHGPIMATQPLSVMQTFYPTSSTTTFSQANNFSSTGGAGGQFYNNHSRGRGDYHNSGNRSFNNSYNRQNSNGNSSSTGGGGVTRIPPRLQKQKVNDHYQMSKPTNNADYDHLPKTNKTQNSTEMDLAKCDRLVFFSNTEILDDFDQDELSVELKVPIKSVEVTDFKDLFNKVSEIDAQRDRFLLIHALGPDAKSLALASAKTDVEKGAMSDELANELADLVEQLTRRLPHLKVLLSMLTPRFDHEETQTAMSCPNSVRKVINVQLSMRLHDNLNVTVINNDLVLEWYKDEVKRNRLFKSDGQKLTAFGMSILLDHWKTALTEVITKTMGWEDEEESDEDVGQQQQVTQSLSREPSAAKEVPETMTKNSTEQVEKVVEKTADLQLEAKKEEATKIVEESTPVSAAAQQQSVEKEEEFISAEESSDSEEAKKAAEGGKQQQQSVAAEQQPAAAAAEKKTTDDEESSISSLSQPDSPVKEASSKTETAGDSESPATPMTAASAATGEDEITEKENEEKMEKELTETKDSKSEEEKKNEA